MPVHLRWDLYPIPHEKGKHHYGGSYFEEIDWWTKPAEVSVTNELKEMSKEIIFIQSMYHNNRPLWMFSFPFHFGLYLSIVFVLMVFLSGFLGIFGMEVSGTTGNIIGQGAALSYTSLWDYRIGPRLLLGRWVSCSAA